MGILSSYFLATKRGIARQEAGDREGVEEALVIGNQDVRLQAGKIFSPSISTLMPETAIIPRPHARVTTVTQCGLFIRAEIAAPVAQTIVHSAASVVATTPHARLKISRAAAPRYIRRSLPMTRHARLLCPQATPPCKRNRAYLRAYSEAKINCPAPGFS